VGDRQPAVGVLGEDRPVRRRAQRLALVLTVVLGLTSACSTGGSSGAGSPAASPTASSAPPVAAAPPAAPPEHACYALTLAQAVEPTTSAGPVPCSATHTTVTIQVGTIRPVLDGHLLAVDSDTVQKQIARRCQGRLAPYVGGDEQTRRLSRFTVVWFSPTLADSDRGALWFRCDLVALAGHDQLAPLPGRARHVLASADALDRFGTCGTAAPSARRFQRVICSGPHTWRARTKVDLPAKTTYLDKAAGAAADSTCHDVESRLASDVLKLQWSFEWPSRSQWDSGQRFGYCWTPDPA
jgi:Septum formation